MSTPIEKIYNGNGGVYQGRTGPKRANRETVSIRGVSFDVDYDVDGAFMFATSTDPAEIPTCVAKTVEVNGADITRAIRDTRLWEEIEEAVEALWRQP